MHGRHSAVHNTRERTNSGAALDAQQSSTSKQLCTGSMHDTQRYTGCMHNTHENKRQCCTECTTPTKEQTALTLPLHFSPAEAGEVELDLLRLHRRAPGLVHAGAAERPVPELVRLPHGALLGVLVHRPQLAVRLKKEKKYIRRVDVGSAYENRMQFATLLLAEARVLTS